MTTDVQQHEHARQVLFVMQLTILRGGSSVWCFDGNS